MITSSGLDGLRRTGVAVCLALVALLAAGAVNADDFCCPCKNKPQSIEASDRASATAQCSIACKRFVFAKPGRCEGDVPEPGAPAETATAPAAKSLGTVLLFKTDDCSGDATPVTASSATLPEGYLSFQGESGEPVQVWEKPDFAGASTQPVAPGICLSPGWGITGVRIGR